MTGDIMTISRLRMGTDGSGVTTLVGLFGCPLHCRYCLNEFCHDTGTIYNGTPRGAYTPSELIDVLKKDDVYYRMSGGGVTFGGGEPLLQSEFIREVCQRSPREWKKRIETSLNVPWEKIEPLIGSIDEWIVDIKDVNPDIYKAYTGSDNHLVLTNLKLLASRVGPQKLHIRVPLIPEFNDYEDIDISVKWVREELDVEPEEFGYVGNK